MVPIQAGEQEKMRVINIEQETATKQEMGKARELVCPDCNMEMGPCDMGAYCHGCRTIWAYKFGGH